MKLLYVDCFSGIAGDMMLGALLDVGVPEDYLRAQLALLDIDGWTLQVGRTLRHGISGVDVKVHDSTPVHHHTNGSHHHGRRWLEIKRLIEASTLQAGAKSLAMTMFSRLAEAEGKLHNKTPEEIHFHEVGAVDAIVDICGVAIALDWLNVDVVASAPIPTPQGWVKCAHGQMPLPSPATLELLRGAQTQRVDGVGEWVTPTGAAILAGLNVRYGPIPSMRITDIGYGAGDNDPEDRPNLLRLVLGEVDDNSSAEAHDLLIEANIDDMTPELCGHVSEQLFALGVYDVWMTPIYMKKGRPAITLSVLCADSKKNAAVHTLLTESTTIGVRMNSVQRHKTAQSVETIETSFGPVLIKVARDGDRVVNRAPEYEDCRRIAEENNLPLKEVIQQVWGALSQHKN